MGAILYLTCAAGLVGLAVVSWGGVAGFFIFYPDRIDVDGTVKKKSGQQHTRYAPVPAERADDNGSSGRAVPARQVVARRT